MAKKSAEKIAETTISLRILLDDMVSRMINNVSNDRDKRVVTEICKIWGEEIRADLKAITSECEKIAEDNKQDDKPYFFKELSN